MIKYIVAILVILTSSFANAGGIPRPLGGESRIKIINYTPNTVFKFVGHYEFQSIIEFGIDEEIDTISMGTPTPWQMIPAGNRIFLKPVEENATTNMTVITNKRMYFFEMHAEEATGVHDENLNFVIKFVYPEQYNLGVGGPITNAQAQKGPDLTKPEIYNYDYSISGDESDFEPLQVFDDGEFTYLKFRDINAEFPAIFVVDSDGSEGLVNYRQSGGYVVIERVAHRFTLRHGSETICIFNERGRFATPKQKPRKYYFF